MTKRTHRIPLGTKVSFEGDSGRVYETGESQTILECAPDCKIDDHDCYPEPYITVREIIVTAKPLSQLRTIFGEDYIGRDPTDEEKSIDGEL